MATAVKFAEGSEDVLNILAVPFGGPIGPGKDTDGEFFSAKTDLCLDWYPAEIPLLYGHGMDEGPGVQVIGRVDRSTARKEDDGWWVQAQLDKSNAYHARIKELIERQALYASSGAMPHLVARAKSGEITRWPWVELSLTPAPANLYAVVEPADVAKHFKAAGIDFPAARKAELDAAARDRLPDSDYAYIDSEGGRHLPINDEAHVRAAMSRFDTTHFESDAAKEKAAKKIVARAKKLGIEVGDDSAVAEAAKAAKPAAHTAMRNHVHTHADGTTHSHAHTHPEGEASHDGDGGMHKYDGRGKAMADGETIPADGDDGDSPEGSAEDWIEDLNRLLNRSMGGPFDAGYAYVVATFGINGPGYCVARFCGYDYDADDDGPMFYRVEFELGDDGDPVLGAVTPLDRVYIPAKAGDFSNLTSLALLAEAAHRHAAAATARTKDVQERRIKEGRTLSSANVARLQAVQKALNTAAAEIGGLLDGAQKPAKAADAALLRLLDLRTRDSRLRIVE